MKGPCTMLRSKVFYSVVGGIALLAASGATYKAVTGECPVAAICHCIHGDKCDASTETTTAQKPTAPTNAN